MTAAVPPDRKVTRVAVGVLIRGDGRVLLADRPVGKPYAGYWEFPGGKIEPGEEVDAALERELQEELGVDIGPSVPWVTFEFDYPHAYVELQFRVARQWGGVPHAREGQRLDFFDPAGELPRPLLPAAVPALRWLLLPRTVLVIGAQGLAALAGDAAASHRQQWRNVPPMIVVDADWRAAAGPASLTRLCGRTAAGGSGPLASGPGASRITSADGVVLEADALREAGLPAAGLRGAWVDSDEELRLASGAGCDFVLVRSSALAETLHARPAPLPAYLPLIDAAAAGAKCGQWPGQGRWIDLRQRPAAARV